MNTETQTLRLVHPVWKRVDRLADLVAIFEPGVQICSHPRALDPEIIRYLDGAAGSGTFQIIETGTPTSRLEMSPLPAGAGREALMADLTFIKDVLHDLVGCPETGVRIARMDHAMCPGWHFDQTGIRLVRTYRGAGTEWLENQSTDRTQLGRKDLLKASYQQASAGEIILLKGSLWQDNQLFGAIHRSPAMQTSDGLRTVATIDPLWYD